MKKPALLILTLALAAGSGKAETEGNDYLAPKSDPTSSVVGYTFAAFPMRPGLYTDTKGGRQYVAFFDADRIMNVAQRSLPDGPWKYVKLDECNPWDSHNSIIMTMDSRGALHLTGNMHVQKLVYFCTDVSGDISTLKRVTSLVGRDEDRVTYPGFIHLPDGELIFHYRYGRSGDGKEIYDKMGTDGSWSRFLDVPLIDGKGVRNAYMSGPTYRNGYFHLIWVWRDHPDCSMNRDLNYARSKDLKHWESIGGTPVNLPITIEDTGLLVDPVPLRGGLLNGAPKLGWDKRERPIIAYFKFDENGCSNLYVARYESDKWNIRKVTDWKFRWWFQGGGSIVKEIMTESISGDKGGDIILKYTRFNPKTSEKWSMDLLLDQDTLEPKGEKQSVDRAYPEWMDRLESGFPAEMQVNVRFDNAGGKEWFLRWESMTNNRDTPVIKPYPEPAPIRVIYVKGN